MTDQDHQTHELLCRALEKLRSAIELLDLADAPGHIAGHIDLGACQVADLITRASGVPERTADQPCPGSLPGEVGETLKGMTVAPGE